MSKKELIPVKKSEMAFLVIGWGLIFGVIGKLLMDDVTGFLSRTSEFLVALTGAVVFIGTVMSFAGLMTLTVTVILGTYLSRKGGSDDE